MRFAVTLLAFWFVIAPAAAQSIPPFYGVGTAYDPQVSTINSGVLLDAQATVSEDRKHVTLNMRPSANHLAALVPVPVVTGVGGFVGGATFPNDAPAKPAAKNQPPAALQTSPDAIERAGKSWILAREGIYFVQPLK